jgi:hypothetical protein
MKRRVMFAAAVIALASAVPAHADPTGPGPGVCMFLGAHYNVYYYCDEPQPWLQYGTADNPPYGSPLPAQDCAPPNQHDVGCS